MQYSSMFPTAAYFRSFVLIGKLFTAYCFKIKTKFNELQMVIRQQTEQPPAWNI